MAYTSTPQISTQKREELQRKIFRQELKIFFQCIDMEELRQRIKMLQKENATLKKENERWKKK